MVLLEDKELEEYAEEEDEEEEDKEKGSFESGSTNSTATVPPNSFFYQTITSSSSSTPSRWVRGGAGEPSSSTETARAVMREKEHMFDKVVTPSDVGKLNRLVIPKQHAEKYFPLDSAGSEKGLLLNFEDGAGKQWRFRYSYWNSSQSYVMTKGWSRFVKDKKLDAGDIVSFERGASEPHRHRFFIDWKRRPGHPPSHFPHHHHHRSAPWGRLFFPPMPTYTSSYAAAAAGSAASFYNLHPLLPPPPLVYESLPLMQGKTGAMVAAAAAGKRVRLFGVNLDCPEQHELQQQQHHGYGCSTDATAKLPPQLQLQLYNNGSGQAPTSSGAAREVPGKQKQSLSLDLDI